MTLPITYVHEVRSSGSDLNGGCFDPAPATGTDYSQQDTAQLSIADADATGTTNLHSTTGGFTSAMRNNGVQVSGGTLTAGVYNITAFVDTNNVTLDRTPGTGSGSTAKVGGGFASLGQAGSVLAGTGGVAGNTIFVKNGTYNLAGTANVSNGKFNLTRDGTVTSPTIIVGYNTDRTLWNSDTGPTLKANADSMVIIDNNGGSQFFVRNILFDNNGHTNCNAWRNNNGTSSINDCQATGTFSVAFSNTFGESHIVNCYVTGAVTGYGLNQSSSMAAFCVATACTSAGFEDNGGTGARHFKCLSFANAGYGFHSGAVGSVYDQCTSYGNTGANGQGFSLQDQSVCVNCVSTGNSKFGFTNNTGVKDWQTKLYNCAGFNNTSGNTDSAAFDSTNNRGFITLTADPFTNAVGKDFSLNNTAGGGAALRGKGFPASYLGTSTNAFFDVGASQHQDSGGGGGLPNGAIILIQSAGS